MYQPLRFLTSDDLGTRRTDPMSRATKFGGPAELSTRETLRP